LADAVVAPAKFLVAVRLTGLPSMAAGAGATGAGGAGRASCGGGPDRSPRTGGRWTVGAGAVTATHCSHSSRLRARLVAMTRDCGL
jgi:hypothetical protein